jgi:hypothetical protein
VPSTGERQEPAGQRPPDQPGSSNVPSSHAPPMQTAAAAMMKAPPWRPSRSTPDSFRANATTATRMTRDPASRCHAGRRREPPGGDDAILRRSPRSDDAASSDRRRAARPTGGARYDTLSQIRTPGPGVRTSPPPRVLRGRTATTADCPRPTSAGAPSPARHGVRASVPASGAPRRLLARSIAPRSPADLGYVDDQPSPGPAQLGSYG